MYIASEKRYEKMKYNRCGKSGLMLPAVSFGLWHNFGDTSQYSNMEEMCFTAFDNIHVRYHALVSNIQVEAHGRA